MLTREHVLLSVNQLPDKFSIDEIIDKMVLLEKIENGLLQSQNNEVINDDDLDAHLPKWLFQTGLHSLY